MWIAMLCSVTVSMGEETKGVFREMRFVIGVSRATSAAAKPVAVLGCCDYMARVPKKSFWQAG